MHLNASYGRGLGIALAFDQHAVQTILRTQIARMAGRLYQHRAPVRAGQQHVRQALHGLEDLRLAGRARSTDGRVAKFEHWLGEAFNFSRAETALVCVLLLRGPQTPGELRGRTERLHRFEEIADVLAGLQNLMERAVLLAAGGPIRKAHFLLDSEAWPLNEGGEAPAECEPASGAAGNQIRIEDRSWPC